MKPMLTTDQVAELLQVPESTVRHHARTGVYPDIVIDGVTVAGARRVGRHWRIHEEAVLRYLANGAPLPGDPPRPGHFDMTPRALKRLREMA